MCDHHDPLDDDLDAIFGSPAPASDGAGFAQRALSNATSTVTFEEPCDKCRGSGRFVGYTGRVLGECFTCKGSGKRRYKTPAAEREANREKAAAKRQSKAEQAAAAAAEWLDANPVEAAWLRQPVTGTFTFHADMLEALNKYGHFTPKQEAAVRNAAAKSAARKAEWAAAKVAREEGAATVDISHLRTGFNAASEHLKRPSLRVAGYKFSLAPATGRNAGSIYAVRVEDDAYLGKITEDNRFIASRECNAATEAEVLRIAGDPKAAAEAHGHAYGQCSCCGRELTNPESVERGIGPICADRWGW